jgi:hypothetical protein
MFYGFFYLKDGVIGMVLSHSDQLQEKFRSAIEELAQIIEDDGNVDQLLGIGFLTNDDVDNVVVSLLYEGDLPDDAEVYLRFSPAEWENVEEAPFEDLNGLLIDAFPSDESEDEYKMRVYSVFEACADVVEDMDLEDRFGVSLFLTFAAGDPNDTLLAAEKKFVRRMNSSDVFEEWCEEFA